MPQINLRIDGDQKEEWCEYVEESSEYSTVSGLIRAAVTREVEGSGQGNGNSESIGRVDDRLSEMEEALAELQRTADSSYRKLDSIAETVHKDAALADLAPEVFAKLPNYDNRDEAFEGLRKNPVNAETGEKVEGWGTLDWISDRVNVEPERAREAIKKLQRDTARVRSMEINGEMHYWKQV